jgi:hypothetical protein
MKEPYIGSPYVFMVVCDGTTSPFTYNIYLMDLISPVIFAEFHE